MSYKNKWNSFSLMKEIFLTINRRRKLNILFLFLSMIISGVAEVFSLALIIPFLTILTNPKSLWDKNLIQTISKSININSPSELLLPFTILFCIAAIISAFIRVLTLKYTTTVASKISNDLSCDTYYKNLCQPYEEHINRNSSEIISAITSEIVLTYEFIFFSLEFLIAIFIATLIVISLVYINWIVSSIALSTFCLIYLIFSLSVRRNLLQNSKLISMGLEKQLQILKEGLNVIRDIILDRSQNFYIEKYRKIDKPLRNSQANNFYIARYPKYIVESIGVILIAFISFALTLNTGSIINGLPIMGAIAFGSQKLLPLMQIIYSKWADMRARSATVAKVLSFLRRKLVESPSNLYKQGTHKNNFKFYCELKDISYKYKNSDKYVLKKINFKISKGESIGIIGETGGGKSTLIDIFIGLLKPSKGKIYIDGVNIYEKKDKSSVYKWRQNIAHVPQKINLFDASILENITLGIKNENIDFEQLNLIIKITQLEKFVDQIGGINQKIGEDGIRISGGQRQKIGIARALYKRASILVLDEATSALDNQTEEFIMDNIQNLEREMTKIMIAHRIRSLKNCDRIIKIENGKLIKHS